MNFIRKEIATVIKTDFLDNTKRNIYFTVVTNLKYMKSKAYKNKIIINLNNK
jgi:hypothetical protein